MNTTIRQHIISGGRLTAVGFALLSIPIAAPTADAATPQMSPSGVAASAPSVAGQWISHLPADIYTGVGTSGAHNNVVKLIDTERYVYYQILGVNYYTGKNPMGFDTPHSSIFRRDKLAPSESADLQDILPLSYSFPLCGANVVTIEYSPAAKSLAIAYEDGNIDLITDDGRLSRCDALSRSDGPGRRVINTLGWDPDGSRLYAATSEGVMTIDAADARCLSYARLYADINAANRVGSRLVLFSGGKIYAYPADNAPASLDALTPLKAPTLDPSSLYLDGQADLRAGFPVMPLTDNTFAYTLQSKTNIYDGPWIAEVTLPENEDSSEASLRELASNKVNYSNTSGAGNGSFKQPNEGLVTTTARGYMVNTTDFFILLDLPAEGEALTLRKIAKTGMGSATAASSTQPTSLRASSFDGLDFEFFYPREGMRRRTVSTADEGKSWTWSQPAAPHTLNASTSMRARYLTYSPEYGMMARNPGDDYYYESRSNQADILCAYRGGEWTDLGLMQLNPSLHGRQQGRTGIGIDPLDTRYLWTSSKFHGLSRLNLADPSAILHMSYVGHRQQNQPGFVAVHPRSTGWNTTSIFSPVVFDNDGVLWTAHIDWDHTSGSNACVELWYMEPEKRKLLDAALSDASQFPGFGKIVVPTTGTQTTSIVTPLSSETNSTTLCFLPCHYQTAFIIDHKGTLDDTTDDLVGYLDEVYDRNTGAPLQLSLPQLAWDDPDGYIYISFLEGILKTRRDWIFSPETSSGDKVAGKKTGVFLSFTDGRLDSQSLNVGENGVLGHCIDGLGRHWLATVSGGVYCLSADMSALLAHFDSENSPLPTDFCLAACYNPESASVFIATDLGLMEFVPDGSAAAPFAPDAEVRVAPAVVEPHFRGYVTVTGLDDSMTYSISPALSEALTLKASGGALQLDSRLLLPGKYDLLDADGNSVAEIVKL